MIISNRKGGNDMKIKECDIFNDDSAKVIEVEEKPKDE